MRYFFESAIEKKEKGYMIRVPFNVWEVCKQRDVIQAEIVLDNDIIECELLPIEKGNYEIHIEDEDAVKVALGVPHKILLHINGSLIAMLAGLTIAEVISVMDCREWQATMGRMISALNYYGIDHSDIIVYTEGREAVLPKCCIMMEKMGRYCHYLIHFDGKYYDSNLGVLEEYDMSKLLGYLEIKC